MKNIHLIPTNNPSRLLKQNNNKLILSKQIVYSHISKHLENINQNICITNDEEIKEGDWIYSFVDNKSYKIVYSKNNIIQSFYHSHYLNESKKIILTTDQDLIKDGVQAINDEFLEWFVKNSSCEEIEIKTGFERKWVEGEYFNRYLKHYFYKIIIPKEEPKQETLEEVADRLNFLGRELYALKLGAKWQQEQDKKLYSEEDVREAFKQGQDNMEYSEMYGFDSKLTEQEWFEQFKKK